MYIYLFILIHEFIFNLIIIYINIRVLYYMYIMYMINKYIYIKIYLYYMCIAHSLQSPLRM